MSWTEKGKRRSVQPQLFINLSPEEERVITVLRDKEQVHADELLHNSGLPSNQLAATLLQLEMQGLVKTLPGKMYRLN